MQEWENYKALAIKIRSKARSFRFSLLNAYRQSRYVDKIIVPLFEEITNSTLLQHNAMQLGVFHLLDSKRQELEKKVEAVEKQKEYLISKIMLRTLLNGHVIGEDKDPVNLKRLYE